MSHRNSREEYSYREPDPTVCNEPSVKYSSMEHQDVHVRLQLLNHVAAIDEQTACIQYPAGDAGTSTEMLEALEEAERTAVDFGLRTISFDIDMTLRTGEDFEEDMALVDPQKITDLQSMGYIVGTCSDRNPSDQLATMQQLGQEPNFCVPKEMLGWVKKLLPGPYHLHVGDDRERDQKIAAQAGWEHQWPGQFQAEHGA